MDSDFRGYGDNRYDGYGSGYGRGDGRGYGDNNWGGGNRGWGW